MGDFHVISTFEHSAFLELALIKLHEQGIEKEKIVAIPLEKTNEQPKLLDTIHRADGISLFDLSAVMATIFSILGASFGFELTWGPIIWGLIGLGLGAISGFTIDFFYNKRSRKIKPATMTEVVLIIKCKESEFKTVKNILYENMALGLGKLKIK